MDASGMGIGAGMDCDAASDADDFIEEDAAPQQSWQYSLAACVEQGDADADADFARRLGALGEGVLGAPTEIEDHTFAPAGEALARHCVYAGRPACLRALLSAGVNARAKVRTLMQMLTVSCCSCCCSC